MLRPFLLSDTVPGREPAQPWRRLIRDAKKPAAGDTSQRAFSLSWSGRFLPETPSFSGCALQRRAVRVRPDEGDGPPKSIKGQAKITPFLTDHR
jgi:hypothetical protein